MLEVWFGECPFVWGAEVGTEVGPMIRGSIRDGAGIDC